VQELLFVQFVLQGEHAMLFLFVLLPEVSDLHFALYLQLCQFLLLVLNNLLKVLSHPRTTRYWRLFVCLSLLA